MHAIEGKSRSTAIWRSDQDNDQGQDDNHDAEQKRVLENTISGKHGNLGIGRVLGVSQVEVRWKGKWEWVPENYIPASGINHPDINILGNYFVL